ncbi:MAG: hypothetical protein E7064_08645 [Spirochaetaceae bacterium]|nr:hypothetical protein [Spirochaetaceae bacterium]
MKQTLIHEIQLQNYLNIRNDENPAFDNFKLKCSNVFLLFLQTLLTDFVILVLSYYTPVNNYSDSSESIFNILFAVSEFGKDSTLVSFPSICLFRVSGFVLVLLGLFILITCFTPIGKVAFIAATAFAVIFMLVYSIVMAVKYNKTEN